MNIGQIYAGLLDGTMKPRYHAGVGMLQLYLTDIIRLHVWHPDLPPKIEAFGNRHDHRFNMTSQVFLGAIHDTTFLAGPPSSEEYVMYKVRPYHEITDGPDGPVRAVTSESILTLGCVDFGMESYRKITAGESYNLPNHHFHETKAEGLTVTVMRKRAQVDEWARIIAHSSVEPAFADQHSYTDVEMAQCFFQALRRLNPSAIRHIESQP